MMRLLFIPVILLTFIQCFAQTPTYTLTVKNGELTSINTTDDAFEFDVYISNTNGGVTNFEFAGSQLNFSFNRAVLTGPFPPTASDTSAVRYRIIGSDLPVAMQPRNPQIATATSPTADVLRTAINTFPGAGSGIDMTNNGFPGTKIVRMRLHNKTGTFNSGSLNLAWRNPPIVAFATKIFAYVGTTNTDITTPATHSVDPYPWDPSPSAPVANFYSDSTTIHIGGVVDFFDSSLNTPTSWAWSFPGGVPSSSNLQNPINIQYTTPGQYSVTLFVSNTLGSDTITKNNYITVLPTPGCTVTWKNTIRLCDAGNTCDSLIFGTSPFATYGIDTCLGERIIPPIPPLGIFDCRFQLPPNIEETKIDFRKDTLSNIVWWMKFQPASTYPFTFTWNPSNLPNTGFFYLRDGITGSIVNINMKNQSSYTLTNTTISLLKIEYLYRATLPVIVNAGWNMTSVPVLAEDMSVSSLFPGITLPAYGYNNGYIVSNTLVNGKGYWLKFASGNNYPITGIQVIPRYINVNSGWNMIGPFDENIPVNKIISTPSGIVISQYFGFNNGYFSTDTLLPGKAYWVRTNAAGTLMKDTSGTMDNDNLISDSLENWVRFEITDNSNNTANLYLANQNEITESYDLPPIPPSGIFDVRFGSDKFIESFGHNHSIKIHSATRPLKIRAFNLSGNKYIIRDAINGVILNRELTEGVEITLNENIDELILIEQSMIPKVYELSQNYPNPFNPATIIDFQIPRDEFTKLTIYDVLGKEVQVLVNEFMIAGTYKVNFNASHLSTGAYFYRLESGSFSDIKRMILIK